MSSFLVNNQNSTAIVPYIPKGMEFIKQESERAGRKAFKQAFSLDRASLNWFPTESLITKIYSFDSDLPDELILEILSKLSSSKDGLNALFTVRIVNKKYKRLADVVLYPVRIRRLIASYKKDLKKGKKSLIDYAKKPKKHKIEEGLITDLKTEYLYLSAIINIIFAQVHSCSSL